MRTIHHLIAHVVPLVGMGLLLAGLFGGQTLPAASAAGMESFEYQHDRGAQRVLSQICFFESFGACKPLNF
jgi:hypothetical protein